MIKSIINWLRTGDQVRPWGRYDVLYSMPHTKVKRIAVKPGKRLSYQFHHRRREVWVVVQGTGRVTLGDGGLVITGDGVIRKGGTTWHVNVGDTIVIPMGCTHRIGCPSRETERLQFIEVQTGEYFGEDDIVRLEDDWNRT